MYCCDRQSQVWRGEGLGLGLEPVTTAATGVAVFRVVSSIFGSEQAKNADPADRAATDQRVLAIRTMLVGGASGADVQSSRAWQELILRAGLTAQQSNINYPGVPGGIRGTKYAAEAVRQLKPLLDTIGVSPETTTTVALPATARIGVPGAGPVSPVLLIGGLAAVALVLSGGLGGRRR